MAKAKVTFAALASGPSRLRRKKITIGEWGGGTFYILEISGTTHRDLIGKIEEIKGDDSSPNADKAGLLASTWLEHLLVDEDGKSPDKEWLMQQSLRLLIDICNCGQVVSNQPEIFLADWVEREHDPARRDATHLPQAPNHISPVVDRQDSHRSIEGAVRKR